MKLFESLHSELNDHPKGEYAPYYYRGLGYRASLKERISMMRAKGIESLFTLPEPRIHPGDRIAGSTDGLYADVCPEILRDTRQLVDQIGRRSFPTNYDHYSPNYDHVMTVGVPGLLAEIDASLLWYREDPDRTATLSSMRVAMAAFRDMIAAYGRKAEALIGDPAYDETRLRAIRDNCAQLVSGAPETFEQALQLMWLCHTAFLTEGRYAMALGRMDQYLYPFFSADIAAGRLTRDDAIELLENVFIKIHDDVVNICVGGCDENGVCQVNDLSACIVTAVQNCNIPGPNLSARITADTPDDFLLLCLDSIGTGLGYPALMNDAVDRAALEKYGYDRKDVANYSMVGCIENFITGMQPPWSDGRFDTPRFFDYVFHRGVSAFNKSVGIDLGDVEELTTMEQFLDAFAKELDYGVARYCAEFRTKNESIDQKYFCEPFLSCFCYDCIGRGLDINNGGSKYPSVHGAAVMGIGTVADALAAVEKVVYVDHAATLTELGDALAKNFEGYEALHRRLLDAPKYGNNDDFVDKYAVWLLDYLSVQFAEQKTRDGGGFYIAMAANVSNISAGNTIAATPDGRLQGQPLSDAASPTYGRDTRGATVTLNSVAKPDYTKAACGTVVNQKFSPAMFRGEKRQKMLALVKTYFKHGGQELQMNATSRETLLDAMEHPEKYPTLVVRVSGFSDYFVRLDRSVQLDILNRTQHE